MQTETIGSGGGSEEQTVQVIVQGLTNINNIFYINREKIDDEYHGQPYLLKTVNEQLEEQGGLEEVESNIFHSRQMDNDAVQLDAKETKEKMNNIKKDGSNE